MRTKPILLSHVLFLFLLILNVSEGFSQNVGIGTVTPAYRLDVNGVINSASEYRLFGKTIFRLGSLSAGLYRNFSAGDSAGFSNTTGFDNTFIGGDAGILNTVGYQNCFLGSRAGYKNASGNDNTFIGSSAGYNSSAFQNTFVGSRSGFNNGIGFNNTLLGFDAGSANTSGYNNTFLGAIAGSFNSTGTLNVFVGANTGEMNTTGGSNTLLGAYSDLGGFNLTNATAIGSRAYVGQSNSIVLGSIAGQNGATQDTRVGIGTLVPTEKLDVVGNIKVSGEVNVVNIKVSGEINHTSTGTSNLLPIAFGSISSSGAINSSSGNFTVTRTSLGVYTIAINNRSYSLSSYTTVITTVASPLLATSYSDSGNLIVRLFNLSGFLTDGTFHFVVYKQ